MANYPKTNDNSFPFGCGFSTRLNNVLGNSGVSHEEVLSMYHEGTLEAWISRQGNCGPRTTWELMRWCKKTMGASKAENDAKPIPVGSGVFLESSVWRDIKKNAFSEAMKDAAQEWLDGGNFEFTEQHAEIIARQVMEDMLRKRVDALVNAVSDRIQRQVMHDFPAMINKAIQDKINADLNTKEIFMF